jgi:hypothetical protein
MSTPEALSVREWYFVHVLAAMASVMLVACLSLQIYLNVAAVSSFDAPVLVRTLVVIGATAWFWLWIRMVVDFFRDRPSRYPVLWGWVLLLGLFVGGLAYFWMVWRPRNQPE